MAVRATFVVVFLALAALPSVAAQQEVDECARQCEPTDEDVNREPPTTGPVNVILYGHFEDILNMAPLNTVPPDPVFEPDLDAGFLMPTIDTNTGVCVSSNTCADFHFKNSEFTMFFCPGLVHPSVEGWQNSCHGPGPVHPFAVYGRMTLYFYIGVETGPDSPQNPADPPIGTVVPQLSVRGQLQSGFGDRVTLAEGQSVPANLITTDADEHVYEFAVELRPADLMQKDLVGNRMVPAEMVLLRVQVEQVTGEGDTHIVQPDWRLHTGARFPPRLILPMVEPFTLNVSSATNEGQPFVRASARPALGSYDVNWSSLSAVLLGPDGRPAEASSRVLEFSELQAGYDHDGVQKPINATWKLHPSEIDGRAADHSLEFRAMNRQGTFEVVKRMPLPLTEFGGEALPNLSLVVVAFVLLSAAAARRRPPL